MTATTEAVAPTTARASHVRPISVFERVTTELRKLIDFRGGRIILMVTLGLQLVFGIIFTFAAQDTPSISGAVLGILFPLTYMLPVIAIVSSTDEWRQKTVMVTYAQDPNRTAVFVAKILGAILLTLAYTLAGLVIGVTLGFLGGATNDLEALPQLLLPAFVGLVLYLLLGYALGGATLNLAVALIIWLVLGQLVPQILGVIPATEQIAPYINYSTPLNMLASGAWPEDWTTTGVALAIWIAIPLGIGIWRNGTKDIS